MPQSLAGHLRETIDRERPALAALPESLASLHPAGPSSWSPKQELGHLIDSAVNNHLRFVQSAVSEAPVSFQTYAQNSWVELHAYHSMPWSEIIAAWYTHNALIVRFLEQLPAAALTHTGAFANEPPVTLRFLAEDYIVHMQHHLDHLLQRENITPYPQVL